MNISITFKNVPSSDAVKSHIDKKLNKLDKMLDSPAEAQVVLSEEKLHSIAEIKLICDKLKIHAKGEAEENNMYSAIDSVVEKIRIQITKFKEKQKRHLAGDKQSIKDEVLMDLVDSE
ncbi:ribosome hibernation-promoting factor, HPF/YfiA family [uncultured Desulfobacter sp.]|uniref:ribosome hibernation-promoting factor, HPF/YfiA family n=1 Tax=uncultured Desulfobacter sp. TaxID=240139 RepID=UPI0029F5A7B3|nr:ribosome-associated translation inhibitor RaiA [uncultured Desulfobacter sp.]